MGFTLSDFIDQAVKQRDEPPILIFGMRHEYRVG